MKPSCQPDEAHVTMANSRRTANHSVSGQRRHTIRAALRHARTIMTTVMITSMDPSVPIITAGPRTVTTPVQTRMYVPPASMQSRTADTRFSFVGALPAKSSSSICVGVGPERAPAIARVLPQQQRQSALPGGLQLDPLRAGQVRPLRVALAPEVAGHFVTVGDGADRRHIHRQIDGRRARRLRAVR